ncbi:MAG: hypothetical protein ABJB16_00180 [Saprospiraceae bacterium]
MLKHYFKLFSLFIAFTIVVAHSIIPHHHEEATEHHGNSHNDESPLNDAFSHFQHFAPANENGFIHHIVAFKYRTNFHTPKDFISAFVFNLLKLDETVPIGFAHKSGDLLPDYHLSSFLLRGPPSFSA